MKKAALITRVFRDYVDQPRWVGWLLVDDNRVPKIGSSKRNAYVNKPETWRTFAECPDDRCGIVLNGDGLGAVDLDSCRDPDSGALASWAAELVKDFNSHAECSPSGTGVHIIAFGAPKDFKFSPL